jgi:hypothetical protein
MFEPANGHTSRLDMLMPLFENADYGTLVTFAELEFALGEIPGDPNSRKLVYLTMPQVENRLTGENERVVRNVRGVGYRVLEPENMGVRVHDRVKRGKRQFGKARKTANAVPLERITDPIAREKALVTQDIAQRADAMYRKAERELKKRVWSI